MNGAVRPQLAFLDEQFKEMKAKGVYFRLRVLDGEQKAVANFDGRQVINLSSNNYLGLTTHRALRRAAIEAIRRYGVGAGAVRTIAGTMRPHAELEDQIARFKGSEACVVFPSGFTANSGTVAAILGKDDLILSDELNHASIIDGCRLSRAAIRVFGIGTWRIANDSAKKQQIGSAINCSLPMACFRWMAISPLCRSCANSLRNTAAS